MNHSKRGLILASGIIVLVSAFISLLSGIIMFVASSYEEIIDYEYSVSIVDPGMIAAGVISLLMAAFAIIGGVLLIVSVANGNEFKNRQALFISGAVFTIIATGVVSVAAILLYIAFGLRNVEKRPACETQNAQPRHVIVPASSKKYTPEQMKEYVGMLRDMKDKGEISIVEYRELVFELIK